MRRLLEAMDSMSRAETKPTGPKFPGYWKGTDPASAAKNKMVGGAEQESVIPELAKTAKKKSTEWELEEAFKQFKEDDLPNTDDFIKNQKGEWELNPEKYSPEQMKTVDPYKNVVGPAEMDQITDVMYSDAVPGPSRSMGIIQNKELPPAVVTDKSQTTDTIPSATTDNTPAKTQVQVYNDPDALTGSTLRDKINAATGNQSDNSPVKAPNPVLSSPTQTTPPTKPGSWQEIAKLNNITDPTKLRAGQKIALPNDGGYYIVNPNDTLSGIAHSLRTTGQPPGQLKSQKTTSTVERGRPTLKADRDQTPPADVKTTAKPEINNAPPEAVFKSAAAPAKPQTLTNKDIAPEPSRIKNKQGESPRNRSLTQDEEEWLKKQEQNQQSSTPEPTRFRPVLGTLEKIGDWAKGLTTKSTDQSQTPPIDTRRQADIDALKREIKRTPANEKTRLGILNKELADRQAATNESLSQRLAKEFEVFLESDEPYPGYDQDVEKLKQRAKLGPMKTVWDEKTQRYRVVPVKPQEKEIKEYGNAQNADQQATNADQQQTSHAVDPSNPDAMAQKVDIATAKSTMSGLKNILGPQLNTNAAASGIVKMNDGQPLSVPEREAISTLTPLVSKAAEMPATAGALKSALSTAGVLAKQGK